MQYCNTLFFTATFFEARPLLDAEIFQKIHRNHFFAPTLNSYLVITGIGPKSTVKALKSVLPTPRKIVNLGFCAGIKGVGLGQIISPDLIAPWPLPENLNARPHSLLLSLEHPMENPTAFLDTTTLAASSPIITADMEAYTLYQYALDLGLHLECWKVVSDFGASSFKSSFSLHQTFLLSQLAHVASQQHFLVAN
ncbi:MAG: hypothetical protein CVV50_00895 [Spirochaetae bacterium HGW-Spirochaetae-6]|nr:MAG: hypothetical protein CVV50_00895 [Spirochaetae bacterium HGW-Spirochaetae-6]